MEPQSPPGSKGGGSPVDADKLRHKLQRAYLRRDHYAQLYYQTKSELEETKWQLNVALNKIKQFQTHVSKYKSDSLEYHQGSRSDHHIISPPDRNGRISPDSGAISMSPGVESTEGHGQLEDEINEEGGISNSEANNNSRLTKSNSKTNCINESITGSGEIKPTKRVAFRDMPHHPGQSTGNQSGSAHSSFEKMNMSHHPGQSTGNQSGSAHSSFEKMNMPPLSQPQQPILQRSYTFEHGEFTNHFGPDASNGIKMQRTSSYNQSSRPMQGQFSTFPGSYPMQPPHPSFQQQMPPIFNGGSYSIQPPDQHRLPRVHRGYEGPTMLPPPPGVMSPPYHQAPPPPRIIQQQQQSNGGSLPPRPSATTSVNAHSAFQRVPMKQNGGGNMRAHHQYENIMVHPTYYPTPNNHPAHIQLPQHLPPQQQTSHQEKQSQQLYGERWSYSGLSQEEFSQLLTHISLPNTKVERLEIARSNLGRPQLMNSLCKELKKNTTLIELSLPNNDINKESLKTLLMTVVGCKNIKELKLPCNDIGEDSLDVLKQFLEHSSLKALVLSGNEIEHHTHLLDVQLPQDLQYEGVPSNGGSSGPVSPDQSQQVTNDMKLLQI